MKHRYLFMALLLCWVVSFTANAQSTDYDAYWNRVRGNLENVLPASATQTLDSIEEAALAENNQIQLLKSILYRQLIMQQTEEGNANEAFVRYAETKFDVLDTLSAAILHTEIARCYGKIVGNYRGVIKNNVDFESGLHSVEMRYWGEGNFREVVEGHLDAALRPVAQLKQARTIDYLPLFDDEKLYDDKPIQYEPTLFEFIFHRVASFYNTVFYNTMISANDVQADWNVGAWWLPAEDFVTIPLAEENHPVLRIMRIYQELIAYNLENSNENVLIYNDFNRFRFVQALLRDNKAYQEALGRLVEQHREHPLSADIAYEQAHNLMEFDYSQRETQYDNYLKISEICHNTVAKFPDTEAAEGCIQILDHLYEPDLSVLMNQVQLPDESIPVVLEYRNAKYAYFKVVKISEEEYEPYYFFNFGRNKDLWNKLKAAPSVVEQRVNLPVENDFLKHSTLVALPPLSRGAYYLIVTPERNTLDPKKILVFDFQVSSLGFVSDEQNTLVTVDRKTGKPLAGVSVDCIRRDYRKRPSTEKVVARKKSNAEGKVKFNRGVNRYFYVRLRYGDDVLFTNQYLDFSTGHGYYLLIDPGITTTTLYTDRSIYRPGQTVYYHGVMTKEKNDKVSLVRNGWEKINFYDFNRNKIDSEYVWTDEYGSFSGSFVIPEDGPNGIYYLKCADQYAQCNIRVEEYKRPTFEVHFDKPETQYKLNQEVEVSGKVMAYAGFGLDDVECHYRVMRKTSFPWRCYGQSYPQVTDAQVAQGVTRTDGNGRFDIGFMLKPAEKIKPELQPVFTYEVEVKVTIAQGETHSETFSFRAGYNEIAISSNLPSLVEKSEVADMHVEVLNMSGVPARSRIAQKIYRYDDEERINYFETMQESITLDRQTMSDEELKRLFPNYEFYAKDDKTLIDESEFEVNGERRFDDIHQLQPGRYLLELKSLDDTLALLTEQFVVSDRSSKRMPVTAMHWLQVDRTVAQPGDSVHFTFGSSAKDVVLWVKLVHDGKDIRMDQWVEVSEGLLTLPYVITEKDRGMMSLLVGSVKENSFQFNRVFVWVPYDNLDLKVELASMREKLSPGAEETWELTVSDHQGKPVKSALLAGMYDASLDVFQPHTWSMNMKPRSYYANGFTTAHKGFLLESTEAAHVNFQFKLFNFSLPSDAPFFDAIYVKRATNGAYSTYSVSSSWTKVSGKGPFGRLKGTIRDDTGETVPFANIILEKGGEQEGGTTSDFDGIYDINPVSPGTYDLRISCIGYEPFVVKNIVIPANKITFYDVMMQSAQIFISEVYCVDYEIPLISKDNTTSGASITAEEIAKLPVRSAEGVAAEVGGVFSGDGEWSNRRFGVSDYEYIWPGHKELEEVKSAEEERLMMECLFVAPRENFNETAFFNYLKTDKDGKAQLSFTVPDALTRWRMIALAYNRNRQTGLSEYSFSTAKPVMIMADMPRYMYDSDTLWLVANVINTGDEAVAPKVKLEVFDAGTMEPVNLLVSDAIILMDEIVAGRSKEVRWKVAARPGLDLLAFRFTVYAGKSSDAEQHLLPVLSSEVFMTESLPFAVKADTVQTFNFDKANPNNNERDESLILNLSTNPIWYAVQPLPYLDGISTYCAENAFYVFYANTLSAYIADHTPKLMTYIRKWKVETPDALLSRLEKDQELKAILLKETPWVLQAKTEPEQRSRLAMLFDAVRLPLQQSQALRVMLKQQKDTGGWSWIEIMPESPFITTNILMGLGKLKEMGALSSLNQTNGRQADNIIKKAVRYLEKELSDNYLKAKQNKETLTINSLIVDELYVLSFFNQETPTLTLNEAKESYIELLEKSWQSYNFDRRAKAALVLHRNGKTEAAKLIVQSLKETARQDEITGMYWPKDYFTFESKISVHASIMAAFAEIEQDDALLDQMRIWLLSQKRADRWESSASTLDATYALLLRGNDWFDEGKEVDVRFGNTPVNIEDGVAGTGFIQRRWNANEITKEMRQLTVNNPTNHRVWGGLFRQYFVPLDEIKGNESGFTIKRELFVETVTDEGKKLVPVGTALRSFDKRKDHQEPTVVEPVETLLKVGDKLTVKITFENQQDMRFVFVKDLRAAGFEPIGQVSHYEYNDGMSYYQSSTDTDMEFFIEFLPKGVHQLEYSMFVTKEGHLNNGYALIQCQYAPEFSAYSDGMRIRVGE